MPSLPVVKHFHVIEQADPRIIACLVVAVHDQFGLERMEEALHRRIVPTVSLAAHALPDAIAVYDFPVASRGVRGPLVGVQRYRWTSMGDRSCQRGSCL